MQRKQIKESFLKKIITILQTQKHYDIGIKQYKKYLEENMGEIYTAKCKLKDYCMIMFEYNDSG